MAPYNLTNLTNSGTDLVKITQELNVLSGNTIGIMMYLTFIIVFYVVWKVNSDWDDDAIISMVLLTAIPVAWILQYMNLIPVYFITVTAIFFGISLIFLLIPRRQ